MNDLIWIVSATVAVLAFIELVRRAPLWVGVAIFAGLPLIRSFWWSGGHSWFTWAKVYSICVAAAAVVLIRSARGQRWRYSRHILVVLLVLNISEALTSEVLRLGVGPNVLAAALLVFSIPGPSALEVTPGAVRYDLGPWWVAGYTAWNFAFVYGVDKPPDGPGASAGFALVHLLVPLLAMRGDAKLWAEARTYGLAVLMLWRFEFPRPPMLLRTPHWYHPDVHTALSIASLLVCSFVVYRAWKRRAGAVGWIAGRLTVA